MSKHIDGLLVAGMCASATQLGQSAMRGEGCCMVMGQAAGTAAAICVKNQLPPRSLNIVQLQQTLKEQGAVI